MRSIAPLVAVLTALAPAPALPAQKPLAEPRVGFEFRPPKGWLELGSGFDRGATVRLLAAPRAMASRGESSHTPVLRVMHFVAGGDPAADVVDGLPRKTPFRSLADFARRGLAATDVSSEAHEIDGKAGQRVKATGLPGGLTLVGQTWPLDDGEAAVCIEVLDNQIDKLAKEIDAVLGSLKACERTVTAPLTPPWLADAAFAQQDAAARAAARRAWATEIVAAATKEALDGAQRRRCRLHEEGHRRRRSRARLVRVAVPRTGQGRAAAGGAAGARQRRSAARTAGRAR